MKARTCPTCKGSMKIANTDAGNCGPPWTECPDCSIIAGKFGTLYDAPEETRLVMFRGESGEDYLLKNLPGELLSYSGKAVEVYGKVLPYGDSYAKSIDVYTVTEKP
mgnify:CR=1 FL=1